jgi:membrane protein implicated in regulation of membrane protease activity
MKLAVAVFVVGVLVMVTTLSTSFLLAFVGFLVMLGAALTLERNARQVGRTGLRAAVGSGRTTGLRDAVGGTRAKVREQMRDRFRRGDQGRT